MTQEPITAERLLRLALSSVREGLSLQQSLLNPGDDDVWLEAVHAFIVAMPDMPPTALHNLPDAVIIETLERAIASYADE